jgi:hypothetical protein
MGCRSRLAILRAVNAAYVRPHMPAFRYSERHSTEEMYPVE